MLRKIHLKQMWEARPLGVVLLIASAYYREMVLVLVSIVKSVWFVRFVIRRIRRSTQQEFFFHEFMAFIGMSIVLFILSYAIDYYCLFQISADSFRGMPPSPNLLDDFLTFFYFSVTTFTTAGLGDIVPNCASARIFTASELTISFFFTIFIIANLSVLRESYSQKRQP
jgi:Ion channel